MADVDPKAPKRVVVEIFGESYPLRTDDPERLKKLAAGVDHLMKKMAGSVKSFDGTKIAVLTALTRRRIRQAQAGLRRARRAAG